MSAPVPSRAEFLQRWSTLHGGVEPGARSVAGWFALRWLSAGYAAARPLAQARVSPDLLTLVGLLVALLVLVPAAAGGRWALAAAAVVLFSAYLDSLDGAVAVLTDRTSRWGAVLDAVADRVSDTAFVLALWLLGAPLWVALAAAVVALLHEYVRARAGAAGMNDVGTVTASERPTRVVIAVMFMLAVSIHPGQAAALATVGAAAALGVGLIGLGQLLVVVRARLR